MRRAGGTPPVLLLLKGFSFFSYLCGFGVYCLGIELAFQIGEQKGDLGFVGGAGLHGRGLQGFCGYGQVLSAIQHSNNHAYDIVNKRYG